ncbi:hypothetical protein BKA56DRAFT_338922 [Ilyonectria sp. MPI-CAGE-AT-0026]|nr:hypothetical protein BKA56DRAFT_338922 [Ilyonectria sp. MPI-CAGE-AT-0026]
MAPLPCLAGSANPVAPLERLLCNASGSMPTPPKPALLPYDVLLYQHAAMHQRRPGPSATRPSLACRSFARSIITKLRTGPTVTAPSLLPALRKLHGTGRTMCPMYNVRSSCIRLLHAFGRSPGTSLLPQKPRQ